MLAMRVPRRGVHMEDFEQSLWPVVTSFGENMKTL